MLGLKAVSKVSRVITMLTCPQKTHKSCQAFAALPFFGCSYRSSFFCVSGFCRYKAAVKECLRPLLLALCVQRRKQPPPDPFPGAVRFPRSETTPKGDRRTVLARHVFPSAAGAQYIQNPLQRPAVVGPRSSHPGWWWEQWRDSHPLLISQMAQVMNSLKCRI